MINNFVENYKTITDDKLISLINGGEYEFLQIIINRYMPVIIHYADKYCASFDKEDAIQDATFALYSAVKNYDSNKSSFSTFASICIKRSVIDNLKNNVRKKKIPAELFSSLDDITITDSNTPEKIFFDKENLKSLTDTIKLELSALEYNVLQLFLSGETYSDIASKLNITVKSVDNSLKRIRIKLKDKDK